MSVLNTASDGYFNVLIVLVRAILSQGPMPREDLVDLCRAGHDADIQRLRQTLNRWTDLGLFTADNEAIALAQTESDGGLPTDLRDATVALPALLRRIVFREENNARFWDSDKSLSADLTRGLAWFLTQDIYSVNISDKVAIQALEALQLVDPEQRIVQNDVRLGGLLTWGNYLGFLWNAGEPIVDPTMALLQDLPLIFGKNTELTATDLLDRVAAVLPVLDNGSYRLKVETVLDPASWQSPTRPDLLSMALSRALWRLDAQGILVLDNRADAGNSSVLQRAGGRDWRRFTHVRFTGRAA